MPTTPPPAITPLPTPPDPNDRSTFNARAYPWSVAQQTLASEVGAVATNVYNNAQEAVTAANTATAKAGEATTSASTATTKAGEASSSASAANSARIAAEAALDSFDDRYLGDKSADPTTDNDGNPLIVGALYFRTTAPVGMKVKTASGWDDAYANLGSKYDKTGGDVNGNINITGAVRRITGDFSNATVASRVMIQTSSANDASRVGVIPNGTSRSCEVLLINNSDAANAGVGSIRMNNGDFAISAYVIGAGTFVPMTFNVGGAERLRIDSTTGNILATGGALGYGVGNGGTALQSPNNTSAVPLNKPNGIITLANGSISAGGRITFQLQNSLIGVNSSVVAHGMFDGSAAAVAQFTVQAEYAQDGSATISVKNNAASSVATDGVKIKFAVFAGSAS